MIFHQLVIYVLIDDYLKFRKDPSITSQEITNYITVALAVALSVGVLLITRIDTFLSTIPIPPIYYCIYWRPSICFHSLNK